MDDPQSDDLFGQLRSGDPREAWARFLELYSPLLLDVIRLFERDNEAVGDCYLFVCEELSRNGFRRLLRFRPDGPARFTTWLSAVTRNLCLDWHRREFGRHRVFESVARLATLEQEVFRGLFVDLLPLEETFLKLRPRYPALTMEKVRQAAARVQQALTPRQRWLLVARRQRGLAGAERSLEECEAACRLVPSQMPNPETWAALQEERACLRRALSRLTARDRLLVGLRFERGMTLEGIARLLQLDNVQRADREIRAVLERLRRALNRR